MRRPPEHEDPADLADMDDSTDPIGAAIAATAATIAAPMSLRESVQRDRHRVRQRRVRGRVLGGGLAGLAAVTAVALVLVLPGSGPSVADAAKLALASPTRAAPGPGAERGTLDASVSGVRFPTWRGWRVVGQRDQDVAGRAARSVVYESPSGQRVGYAIVSGEALDVPDGTRHRIGGTEMVSLRTGGATVVTWRVAGHTCVLATADDVPVEGLVRFAATTY
jgi:hypothetical protein